LDIQVPSKHKLKHGSQYQIAVEVINKGQNPDIIIPSLKSDIQGTLIALEGSGLEHQLTLDSSFIFIIQISADKIPTGTYDLTISFESLGRGEFLSKNITVEIYEEKETTRDLLLYISISFIIVIIVIIIIFFLFLRHKRIEEEKKRVDAEIVKPDTSKVLDAKGVRYLLGPGKKDKEVAGTETELPGEPGEETLESAEKDVEKLPPSKDEVDRVLNDMLDKLDARFIDGKMSEETYLELKKKYEGKVKEEPSSENESNKDEDENNNEETKNE
jgi:hypothetical protein